MTRYNLRMGDQVLHCSQCNVYYLVNTLEFIKVAIKVSFMSIIIRWENGRPVGEESTIETMDGPRPSVIVPDPRLPPHWVKHLAKRNNGVSAGKWNSVIVK